MELPPENENSNNADSKNMKEAEENECAIIKDVDETNCDEINTTSISSTPSTSVCNGANDDVMGESELIGSFEKNNNVIHMKALEAEALIKVFQPDHTEMIRNLFKLADRVERWQRWTSMARVGGGWISGIAATIALGFGDHMNFMVTDEPVAKLIHNVGMSTAFIGTLTGAAAYFANRTIKDDGFKELEREIRQDKTFYKQVKGRMESIQEIMEENEHLFSKIYPMVSEVGNLTGKLASKVMERWETVQSMVKKLQDLLMMDKKTVDEVTKVLKVLGSVCCTGIPMASMNTGSAALTVIGIMINIYDMTLAFIDYSKNQDARKIREMARVMEKFDRAQEKLKSAKRLHGKIGLKGRQMNIKAKTTVTRRKKSHWKVSANGSSPVRIEKAAQQKKV